MEDSYRQHIIKNVEKLIRYTDYNRLMNGCVQSKLLTEVMKNNIENWEHDDLSDEQLRRERHKRLFEKLTKRGPTAYQRLKDLLIALSYGEAVRLLSEVQNTEFISIRERNYRNESQDMREKFKPPLANEVDGDDRHSGLNSSQTDDTDEKEPKLELYTKKIQPTEVHEVIKSKDVNFEKKVGVYPMRSRDNRGVFFMVNIIDFPNTKDRRNGAEEDGESLLYLFKELGFKLFAYVNLTQEQFFQLLDAVIDSEYARKAECFVMALMTHGDMDHSIERVQFHDGSIVKVRDIEHRFENRRCPNLVRKPKILIFPFCRGEIADRGHFPIVQTDSIRDAEPNITTNTIPTFSDIITCYATMRGFKAHRDSVDGSWYIQNFCKMMALHSHDTNFEGILKLTQEETGQLRTGKGEMQTGSYVTIAFNKHLYFNPGIYED